MRKLKRGGILLFLLLNGYAILCGGLYFFQESLLFHPTQLPQDHTFNFDTPFEEVFLDTKDGARLHGLHFKTPDPKGVILYYHGNAGSVERWGHITTYFVIQQYDVIVMDYRQYGKSTGAFSEQLLYDDSMLWYAFAKSTLGDSRPKGEQSAKAYVDSISGNIKNPKHLQDPSKDVTLSLSKRKDTLDKINNNVTLSLSKRNATLNTLKRDSIPLIIYGRSLGTTFATYVASQNNPDKLILETPFYSIEDEARSRFSFLPIGKLLKYKMQTFNFINDVQAPITIFHGTQDGVVAFEHGKKLYNHIKSDQKTFVTIEGGGHNNLIEFARYRDMIVKVLD